MWPPKSLTPVAKAAAPRIQMVTDKLDCNWCGQPMRPEGEPEQPDHYQHASGCPIGQAVETLNRKKNYHRSKLQALVEMVNINIGLTHEDIESCARDAAEAAGCQVLIDVLEGRVKL